METVRLTRKRNPQKRRRGYVVFLWLAIFFGMLAYIDARVMPPVFVLMEHYGISSATRIIDESVVEVLKGGGVTTGELYSKTLDAQGKPASFSADTVRISQLCAQMSQTAMAQFNNLEQQSFKLPLGVLTGVRFLADKGPAAVSVRLRPVGEVQMDYKTSFASEGINQIHYQIWLEARATVAIVNPLGERVVAVNRNIPIVNEYMNGTVPESMLYPFPAQTAQ